MNIKNRYLEDAIFELVYQIIVDISNNFILMYRIEISIRLSLYRIKTLIYDRPISNQNC